MNALVKLRRTERVQRQDLNKCFIVADFVREISQQSSDRSKKGGTSYWTMDCFRNRVGGGNF